MEVKSRSGEGREGKGNKRRSEGRSTTRPFTNQESSHSHSGSVARKDPCDGRAKGKR